MRFMMIMIPNVYQAGKQVDPNFVPPADMVAEMSKYNEDLAKAGALISLNGLRPLSAGARVSFDRGKPTVTDGPHAEAKEVIGGYWMLQFKNKQEAIDWAKRCPAQDGDVLEIRPVYEMEDFRDDVRKAANDPSVGR